MESQLKDYDLSYLKAPKEAELIKHDPKYIHFIKENNYHVRKIFYKVEYDEYENKKIDEFEAELKRQNISLLPDWDRAKSLKYCLTGQMKLEQSVQVYLKHKQWFDNPLYQKVSPSALKYLDMGLVYQSGRDKLFRPVIYLNVKLFDQKNHVDEQLQAISNLLVRVKKYMYLKGKVENQIVILDLSDISIFSVPVDLIKQIISTITTNFTCSLHRMFLLSPPRIFRMAWNVIRKFMVEETAKKIEMLGSDEYIKIQEQIDPSQLQQKYGGTLPNITHFWPPQSTMKQTGSMSLSHLQLKKNASRGSQLDCGEELQLSGRKNSILGQESEYHTIANNSGEFFKEDYMPTNITTPQEKGKIWINHNEIDINPGQRPTCCACSIF